MIKKVLILTITAGQGHNSTAKAIAAGLEEKGIETKVLDAYYYLSKLLGDIVSKGYLLTLNAQKAYRTTYSFLEKRHTNSYSLSPMRITNMAFAQKMRRFINEYNPDVIITTHILAGILLDVLKQLGELNARVIGVLTDFTFHPYWEESLRSDYVVIPSEFLIEKAHKKGFSDSQILPYGIPINPKFNVEVPRNQARAALGLDTDKPIILLMGGSMGFGHIEKTFACLDRMKHDYGIITVCGNNVKAKAEIDALQSSKLLRSYGYTDQVDILMSACDAIVTKPGGLTTSEALARRLPMIISNPIPGQEDRNTEFLLNHGAAMAVSPTTPLDEVLDQLLLSPGRLRLMRESIELIRKPDSTERLCSFVASLNAGKE